jgi:adenine-specific DNA-methyltransferase
MLRIDDCPRREVGWTLPQFKGRERLSESILDAITAVLKEDKRVVAEDGDVLANKVLELVSNRDEALISSLFQVKELREHFFKSVGDFTIFDFDSFSKLLSSKEWLPSSFTSFRNKIGMVSQGRFIGEQNDVVLEWPYKDCVLEGGMREEEASREEVFYNEIIAPDEVNRLLEPKAFRSLKRFTAEGEQTLNGFNFNSEGTPTDNFLIRGNNLLALHSIKEAFTNKIKLIYIDPPYNTERDMLYNDKFKASTWLTLMKNRLDIAKRLLSEEGLIFVQIDSRMFAHLKVLMDEIFGSENLKSMITVKVKGGGGVGGDSFLLDAAEYILCYAKNPDIELEVPREEAEYFPQEESDYVNLIQIADDGEYLRTIEGGNVGEIKVFRHDKWSLERIPRELREKNYYIKNLENIMSTTNPQGGLMRRVLPTFPRGKEELFSIEYRPMRGKNKGKVTREYVLGGRLVIWLKNVARISNNELVKLQRPLNIWDVDSMYKGIHKEGGVSFPGGKKPEHLIKKILQLHAEPGDIVLDFFLGSGTTAAVAHKLGLQYIGIEQLSYGTNDSLTRLKNVLSGDMSGISRETNWAGGGNFVYLELAERNPELLQRIEKAKNTKELSSVWQELSESPYLAFKVDPELFNNSISAFEALPVSEARMVLHEVLDKNAIYLNLSELEDSKNGLSSEEITLTRQFYGIK